MLAIESQVFVIAIAFFNAAEISFDAFTMASLGKAAEHCLAEKTQGQNCCLKTATILA
ncbi:hypothetical protein [Pseudomonas sp. 24 R 17]|uniref:hypothetical protein n=1 Tax=Pseudomonas sp. 24 R 17 TaxID=1844096 RepID=UPI0008128008|nr:hypothetical protein [Pseudomonas sp. 24 R 17]CRM17732.1 hypothetical protein [Pseudomonas sp. 24 R 17]